MPFYAYIPKCPPMACQSTNNRPSSRMQMIKWSPEEYRLISCRFISGCQNTGKSYSFRYLSYSNYQKINIVLDNFDWNFEWLKPSHCFSGSNTFISKLAPSRLWVSALILWNDCHHSIFHLTYIFFILKFSLLFCSF